jgi:hypothetical protein
VPSFEQLDFDAAVAHAYAIGAAAGEYGNLTAYSLPGRSSTIALKSNNQLTPADASYDEAGNVTVDAKPEPPIPVTR